MTGYPGSPGESITDKPGVSTPPWRTAGGAEGDEPYHTPDDPKGVGGFNGRRVMRKLFAPDRYPKDPEEYVESHNGFRISRCRMGPLTSQPIQKIRFR